MTRRTPPRLAARVRGLLSVPLVRNAYSLVGATLATSGLGVVFWIVAARSYSTAEVGTDAALISAMVFLSRLAQLNLASGFNRFVPTAGRATRRLVLVGYVASIALAVVASIVFVGGIGFWAPKLSMLTHDHWRAAWFVVATVIWTIFVLQDSVLTGLGEAPWVLMENAAYGIIKLAVLVGVAVFVPHVGLFVAWTVPLVLFVVPINRLIFVRFIPARREHPSEDVSPRAVGRYVSVDFVASMMLAATSGLMPLLVLASMGARASAYVFLSWTIAYTVHFLSENVGMSLITEGSRDPDHLIDYARQALVHSLRIVVPLSLAIAAGAPLVLRAFGSDYAAHATHLLQLLTISAIPNAVVVTYLSVARVRRRMAMVVVVTAVQSVAIVVLAIVLLHSVGLDGVGFAWLITDSALAVVLLGGEFRTVWLPYLHPGPFRALAARARAAGLRRSRRTGSLLARETLRASGLAARGWEPLDGGTVGADVYTLRVRAPADSPAVLKIATTAYGIGALRQRVAAARAVLAVAPPGWAGIVPEPFDSDPTGDWSLERLVAGVDGRSAVTQAETRDAVLDDVVRCMTTLYRATAGLTVVDEEMLDAHVDRPLSAPRLLGTNELRAFADAKSLARARVELREALAGRTLTTAVVHGNLWLGNVLWTPETAAVSGIVDWVSTARGFPVVDIAHLLCSTRALVEGREIGAVVGDVLANDAWPERDAARLRSVPGAGEISIRSVILLAWIQHVAGKAGGAYASDVWVTHNVHHVLESV